MATNDVSGYVQLEGGARNEALPIRKSRRIGGVMLCAVVVILVCEMFQNSMSDLFPSQPRMHTTSTDPGVVVNLASTIMRGITGKSLQPRPRIIPAHYGLQGGHARFQRMYAEQPESTSEQKQEGELIKEIADAEEASKPDATKEKGLLDSILDKAPLPSYLLLVTSGVGGIAFVGCIFQLWYNDPPAPVLGVPLTTLILLLSGPGFPLLFALAVVKGNREADEADARGDYFR
eukprot:gnl/TRDRNA2_/TRDRNA2_200867_c0_seq1.p1 gnl/TRDRNA2_/TRDRNA2_200867_c0~~gnl/TRDRNA2_/TRDRNA2_200867_c0_seq1.p1  ORF type:complete len:256 (+),score=34.60 gnl/TRDRNA2_/TRDRNA2_200867_c0_seq1:72-770(+)